MAVIAAHLNAGVILVLTASVAIGIISLLSHLHTPSPQLHPIPNKPYGFCGR